MFRRDIKLSSVKNASGFANAIRNINCDIDIVSGRYTIDAKSIMGLFSLDLSKKVELVAHTENQDDIDKISAVIKEFSEV